MASRAGKARTVAALLRRLFEANWATRAHFVVDRNTLAIQAEDAFAEHPPLPCYRLQNVCGAAVSARSASATAPGTSSSCLSGASPPSA
jgi:hypothetical protein